MYIRIAREHGLSFKSAFKIKLSFYTDLKLQSKSILLLQLCRFYFYLYVFSSRDILNKLPDWFHGLSDHL